MTIKKLFRYLLCVVMVFCCFFVSGCDTNFFSKNQNNALSEKILIDHEFSLDELFEYAVFYGMYENSLEGRRQFINDFMASNSDFNLTAKEVANRCLNNVVSIYAFGDGSDGVGAGSGVVFKIDDEKECCYIVTNYHVISCEHVSTVAGKNYVNYYESSKIYLYAYGNETFENGSLGSGAIMAKFVGGSADYDLAVLKVEGNEFLKIKNTYLMPVSFAEEKDLSLGGLAVAIGNPKGLGLSISSGVVSCDSVFIDVFISGSIRNLRCLRMDTSVNGGNSGGGLFDEDGRLIGIVNAKMSDVLVVDSSDNVYINSAENIGYALPSDFVKNVAQNIVDFYESSSNSKEVGVNKISLGISLEAQNSRNIFINNKNILAEDILVSSVNQNEIGEKLGLKKNDILKTFIVKSNDEEKETNLSRKHILADSLLKIRSGDEIGLVLLRQNVFTNEVEEIKTSFYKVESKDFVLNFGA